MEKKFDFYEPIFVHIPGPSLYVLYLMSFGLTEDEAFAVEAVQKSSGFLYEDDDYEL